MLDQFKMLVERIAGLPHAKEDENDVLRELAEHLVMAHCKYNAFHDLLQNHSLF